MYLNVPSGGFKVVYEYANRLQRRGNQVTIIHPRNIDAKDSLAEQVKSWLWRYKIRVKNRPLISWVQVDANVNLALTPDLREFFLPDGDVIVATAYETAFHVAGYSAERGRKFYLIQSYETWNGQERSVQSSWKLPLHKIVISRQLLRQAAEMGESEGVSHIPIGLDFSVFKLQTPLAERTLPRVGMLAHPNEAKGMQDGVGALQIVKESVPNLQAVLFGTEPRSKDLPEWMEYVQRPSPPELVRLYNSCQVFLNPSWTEGWGLPSAEAMACGCALVSADNGGVHEFAVDGESALIVPARRPDFLAERVKQLLSDDGLRRKLASVGQQEIKEFTWERAVDSLERLLLQRANW